MASAPKDDSVRSVIRSILVSNPRQMTIAALDKDFNDMEGYPIPFSKFGYRNLPDYLKSIPDTVTVTVMGGNPRNAVVLPVTTEKAAHVEAMVMKQRTAPTRSHMPRRPQNHRSASRASLMEPPPPSRPSHEPTASTQRATTTIPSIFDLKFDPKVMEKLKGGPTFNGTQNFNDVSHGSNGLPRNPIPNFNAMPFIPAYPFPNNSMPQIPQMFLPSVGFQPSRPNEPRRNQQPNFSAKPHASPALPTPPAQPKPPTSNTSHRDTRAVWGKVNTQGENILPAGAERSTSHDQFSTSSTSDDGYPAGNDFECVRAKKSSTERYTRSNRSNESVISDYDDSPISSRMQENFKTLLRQHPDGFLGSELPGLYEAEFNAQFSCQDYGYNSIIQMVSEHPNIFSFTRFEKHGDWLLKQPGGSNQNKSDKSMKRWVPPKIKKNITLILQQFPGGLPMSQLLDKYKEFVNESFDYRHYGESLQVVIDDMESYVHQRRVGSETLLYEASRFKKTDYALSDAVASSTALPNVEMTLLHKDLYPEECCGYGAVIPVQKLPDLKFIEVLVSDLENPHRMWFQLVRLYKQLEILMNDLHEFYTRHESKYVMNELTIRPRQLCACLYGEGGDEKWHRAIILSNHPDQIKVTIEYIDYGTHKEVSRSILRFLHNDFAKLPCQAIKGLLSGVYPPVGCKDWPLASRNHLVSLTINRRLMLEISKQQDDLIEVILYDTNGEEDIVINDEMISSGHAKSIDTLSNSSQSPMLDAFASQFNSPNPSVKSDKSVAWQCSPKLDDIQTSTNASLKYYDPSTLPNSSSDYYMGPDSSSDYYTASESLLQPASTPLPAPYVITSGSGTSATSGFDGSPSSPLSRHSDSPHRAATPPSKYALNRSLSHSPHSSTSPLGLSSPSTASLKSVGVGNTDIEWTRPEPALPISESVGNTASDTWTSPNPAFTPTDTIVPPPSAAIPQEPLPSSCQEPSFRRPPPGFAAGTGHQTTPTPVTQQLPFVNNCMPPPQNNWNTLSQSSAISQTQQLLLMQQLQLLQQHPSCLLPNRIGLPMPPMLNNPMLNTAHFPNNPIIYPPMPMLTSSGPQQASYLLYPPMGMPPSNGAQQLSSTLYPPVSMPPSSSAQQASSTLYPPVGMPLSSSAQQASNTLYPPVGMPPSSSAQQASSTLYPPVGMPPSSSAQQASNTLYPPVDMPPSSSAQHSSSTFINQAAFNPASMNAAFHTGTTLTESANISKQPPTSSSKAPSSKNLQSSPNSPRQGPSSPNRNLVENSMPTSFKPQISDAVTQPTLTTESSVVSTPETTYLTCQDTESVCSDWEALDTGDDKETGLESVDSDVETDASARESARATVDAAGSNPLLQRTAKPMSRSGRKRLRKSLLKKGLVASEAGSSTANDVAKDCGKEVEEVTSDSKPKNETKDKSKKNKKKDQEQNSKDQAVESVQTKAKKLASRKTSLRRPKEENLLLEIALEESKASTSDQKTSSKEIENKSSEKAIENRKPSLKETENKASEKATENNKTSSKETENKDDKKNEKSSLVDEDKSEKSSADKEKNGKSNEEKIERSNTQKEKNKITSSDDAKVDKSSVEQMKNDESIVEKMKNVLDYCASSKELLSGVKDGKSDETSTGEEISSDNSNRKKNQSVTSSTSIAIKPTDSDKKLLIDSNSESKGKNKLDLKRELVKDWKLLDNITKDSIYVSKPTAKTKTNARKDENPVSQCDILDRIISSVGAHVFNIEEEKIPPKNPIQKKDVDNKTIHVFEFKSVPTVCTDEIITSFTKFTKRLAVNKALDCKQADKPYFDIMRKNNAELFKLLDNCTICGVTREGETQIPDKLSVLPLEDVSNLLRNLGAVPSVIDRFSDLSEELNKAL